MTDRSWTRSASGLITSRERSKGAYLLPGGLLPIGEQGGDELAVTEKVGDDEVRADAGKALTLPLVDLFARGLSGCDPDGHAAHLLNVFDFDVAVAEAEELGALIFGIGNEALNENLFRKTLVIIESAEDAAGKIARNVEQAGFFAHVDLIGAACEVHFQAAGV